MPPPLSVPRGASRVCPFSYIETATKPSFSLTEPMLTGLTSYKATWLTYRRSSEGFSKSLFFHTNENFRYVLSFRIAKLGRSADITLNETWSISVDTSECEWVSVCVCTAVRTRHWKENMNTSELFHQTATRIIALWVAWLKHSFNVQQPLCVHNTPPDTPLLSYIPIQKKKKKLAALIFAENWAPWHRKRLLLVAYKNSTYELKFYVSCSLPWTYHKTSRDTVKFASCSCYMYGGQGSTPVVVYVYKPTRCTKFLWLDFIFH